MFWSSELVESGHLLGEILPENIIQKFKGIINEIKINSLDELLIDKLNEILFDLIGCLIYGKILSKAFFHLLQLVHFANVEIGQEVLTDVVWYWGIQVSHYKRKRKEGRRGGGEIIFISVFLSYLFFFVLSSNRFLLKLVEEEVEIINHQKDGNDYVLLLKNYLFKKWLILKDLRRH